MREGLRVIGTPPIIFGQDTFLNAFREILKESESVTIVPGFFKRSGFNKIKRELLRFSRQGGQVQIYAEENPYWTDLGVLYTISRLKTGRKIGVKLFRGGDVTGSLHSKIVHFKKKDGSRVAIVGSVNFTDAAFTQNIETSVIFPIDGDSLLEKILDEIAERSDPITYQDYERYTLRRKEYEAAFGRIFRRGPSGGAVRTIARAHGFLSIDRVKRDLPSWDFYKKFWMARESPDSGVEKEINKAVRVFTAAVLNRRKQILEKPRLLFNVLGVYANILAWVDEDGGKKEQLEPRLIELSKLLGLDRSTCEKIVLLVKSKGKYDKLPRGVRGRPKITKQHAEAFLNLLKAFYKNSDVQILEETFLEFAQKTAKMRPHGKGLITAIVSSLKPEQFIVWNIRTSYLERYLKGFKGGKYQRLVNSASLEKYIDVNRFFSALAENAGLSLREVDVTCSELYAKKRSRKT